MVASCDIVVVGVVVDCCVFVVSIDDLFTAHVHKIRLEAVADV